MLIPYLFIAALTGGRADTVAIIGVNVITMTTDRVDSNRTVIIAGDRVLAIGDARGTPVPAGARRIDGRGQTMLPGLTDMHVHLTTSAELPMYLGYGVLAVRDLNGSPQTLAWRDSIVRGLLTGPRIFSSGPMLAGKEIPWSNKVVPAYAADATQAVRAQRAAGYDQIKLYDGLSKEAFTAAVAEARRLGMPSSGHIPVDVGFAGVLASGMTGLEHLDKTVFAVLQHDLDTTRIPAIASAIKQSGMWVTPTLASMMELSDIGAGRFDSLMSRPEALAAPADIREFWRSITARMRGNRQLGAARFNPWTGFQVKLAAGLLTAKVPMLAGTDLPNAVLVPGYSLHEELAALSLAGFSRYQALEAATINPARFFKQDSAWGTIAVGRKAEVILVRGDPISDPLTLMSPVGVRTGGRWFDEGTLASFRRGSGR
jgi:hypothetical protein